MSQMRLDASALQGIGLVHYLDGNYILSLNAYSKNLDIAQSLGNKTGIAAAFQKVGGANYSLADYEKALDAYTILGAAASEL